SGTIQIENEEIAYTGKSGNDLTGAVRAANSTKYAGHASGVAVALKATAGNVSGNTGSITGITTSPSSPKTAVWDIKNDLSVSGLYLTGLKIRVSANDGQRGNPVGTGDSAVFALDAKNPAYGTIPLKINSVAPSVTLTDISVSDDSSFQVRYANSSTANGSSCAADIASASYEAYVATKTWTLSPDANGVSTVCFQAKDVFNNESAVTFAATPQKPLNTRINDISVPPASKYKLLVWWDVVPDPGNFTGYNVYRCDRASADASDKCDSISNFSLLTAIPSRATNYCIDEGDGNCDDNGLGALINTTTYYYKITAQDNDGISLYSVAASGLPTYPNVAGTPNGSTVGEVDTTAPTLSLGPSPDSGADSGSQNSATITWVTGEASYSLVRYGKTTSLGSVAGSATESVTSHSVALSGLDSGSTYYYQILSADPSGNLLQSPVNPPTGLHTFATTADTAAPTISSGPTVTAGRISATVQWTTDEASTTQVKYIAAAGGSTSTVPTTATTLQTEKVTEHYAIITGLTSSTAYNYQIISVDSSGNTLTSPSSSPYPQFTTAGDITDIVAPVISGISSGTPGLNSAAIAWTTDELSYSLVQYGATDALGTFKGAVSIADYTTSHSVALSGLSPGTTYYYKVYSADTSGNLATSSATTFTTAALSISNGPSASASRSGAAISWTTNGLSDSRVEYGAASNLSGSSLTSWQDTTNKVTDHIIYLSSLSPDITYYYRVISRDGNGVSVASSIASFDTTSGAKPVIIAGAAVPADTTSSVTFSATSNNGTPVFLSVEYQSSATLPASYSKESANPSAINSGATGVVALEGLSANNKYYYKLKARDIFGNTQTSASDSYNFTTTIDNIAPAAITGDGLSAGLRIKAPISQNLASTAVTLTWEAPGDDSSTGTATSYDLRYSTSAITDANWSSAAQAANEPLPAVSGATQEMAVAGLAPSTTYYFAIKTSDEIPNISSLSNVLTVATPVQADTTAPVISSVTIGIPSATSVTVTWITDKNSSSLVDFGATAAYGITQGNSADSTKNHSVTLVGLAPSTAYKLRVKSLDSSGNVAINDNSGAGYAFTTASSTAGTLPIISSVQSGSVTATSVVISWTTSVNADSTVGYSSAPDKTYTFESGNSSQLTSHSVTLTNLTPSTDYYYRVKSRNGDQLATSDNNGAGFTFTTLAGADTVPPVISNVQITSVSATKAAITWSTNEASTSYVEFGLAAGSYSSIQGKPSDSTLSHSVELTALTPETAYYFQVRSTDSAGNKAVDNNNGSGYSFTTTSGSTTTCPPAGRATSCPTCETCAVADVTAPKITGVKVADIAFNSAAITWTTDKVSNSMVLYDNVSYGVKQKYGYSSGQLKDSLTSHKITLSNLDSNTTYYFRVSSADSRGNTAESEDQSFKTIAITAAKDKGEAAAVSLKKQFEDIAQTLVKQNLATEENIKDIISRIANPPIIGQEGPVVKDVKSYGATIVWQTDRKANSVVKFKAASSPTEPLAVGSSTSLGASNNWREVGKMDTYDVKHEVELLGLAPNTTYAFQAKSQDILGNSTSSETKTFTTSSNSS
ncbi:MAG: fibronectin type III domain-containing protein, partial [Proteobacteria bacterium]|nr:fibronectin type III domain-containing protein [Pseudomonadota bacterium]